MPGRSVDARRRRPRTRGAPAPAVAQIPSYALVEWPIGPHYLRWVDGKAGHAWARYKLKSADWYLEALRAAEREAGRLDRYVGVEMAVDAVLASLCAAVDAAGFALLEGLGRVVDHPALVGGREAAVGDWHVALEVAEEAGIELAAARRVARALRRESADPGGWLTRLRRLRELSVRRNVLVRQRRIDGAGGSQLIDVPGRGPRPVVGYLTKSRRRAGRLVEALLEDAVSLQTRARRPPHLSPGRTRPLPNLAVRAEVVRPRQ